MPNYCDYEMKIKGSKKAIGRVLDCLKAHYNYGEGKPSHKHFFRVFEALYDKPVHRGGNTYELHIWGDCAWSVFCCMCSGEGTYYNDLKERYGDIFMGTTLKEQSKNCEIEVFSEEGGVGFSEHFIFKNGKCLLNSCEDIETAGYNKNGEITTEIDFDTYDGEYVYLNPHRVAPDKGYRWTI